MRRLIFLFLLAVLQLCGTGAQTASNLQSIIFSGGSGQVRGACAGNNNMFYSGLIAGANGAFRHANGSSAMPAVDKHFVAKYTPSGEFVWAVLVENVAWIYKPTCVSTGQVYMMLFATTTSAVVSDSAGTSLTMPAFGAAHKLFIIRISASGLIEWTAAVTATSILSGYIFLEVDSTGNPYVTLSYGISQGNDTLSVYNAGSYATAIKTFTGPQFRSNVLLKFDVSGAYQYGVWIRGPVNTPWENFDTAAGSLHVDTQNNAYLTGIIYIHTGSPTRNITIFDSNNAEGAFYVTNGVNQYAAFVAKFTPAGTVLWISSVSNANGLGITTSSDGDVYLTGHMFGNALVYNNLKAQVGSITHSKNITATNSYEMFVAKFTASGAFQWAAAAVTGSANHVSPNAVAADATGAYIVSQIYADANVNHAPSTFFRKLSYSGGGGDAFMVKYTPGGMVQWIRHLRSNGWMLDVRKISAGRVVVSGVASPKSPLFKEDNTVAMVYDDTSLPQIGFGLMIRADGATPCNPGYQLVGSSCTLCPPGWFKPFFDDLPCQQCPPYSFNALAPATSISACLCLPGFYGANGSCTMCPQHSYCPQNASLPVPCPSGKVTVSAGAATLSACLCDYGSYNDGSGNCVTCPANSWTSSIYSSAPSISSCECAVGYFGSNGTCTLCPKNSFCALNATKSMPCPNGKITLMSGASVPNLCTCPNGTYEATNGSCIACMPPICVPLPALPTSCRLATTRLIAPTDGVQKEEFLTGMQSFWLMLGGFGLSAFAVLLSTAVYILAFCSQTKRN